MAYIAAPYPAQGEDRDIDGSFYLFQGIEAYGRSQLRL